MVLDYAHALKFMLEHMFITEGASFPWLCHRRRSPCISIIGEILQDTGPAVYMSTFGNARSYHLRQVFETDRALYITCIDHIEDDLHYIFPLNVFIRIVHIQHVIVPSITLDYELES